MNPKSWTRNSVRAPTTPRRRRRNSLGVDVQPWWNATIEFDQLDDGTQYADTAFLKLQSYLGLIDTTANQGSRIFDEKTTRKSDGPDGDTHLHYIKHLKAMEIASMVNGAPGEMMRTTKRYYSIDRHADVAIDITSVGYYGDRDEFEMSTGAPPSKSY